MKCFKPYDIFISHAAEDKEEIVLHLVTALRKHGFVVWYSSDTLSAGASIIDSVERGLSQSRYGIVVLSKNYIDSNWGVFELFYLISKRNKKNVEIIPIWHKVTADEVKTLSYGVMIDIYGISTQEGIESVICKLLLKLKRKSFFCSLTSKAGQYLINRKSKVLSSFFFLLTLTITIIGFWYYLSLSPSDIILDKVIKSRILQLDKLYLNNYKDCVDTSFERILNIRQAFDEKQSKKSHVSYRYLTGYKELKSKIAIKGIGLIPESISANNRYSFDKSTACLLESKNTEDGLIIGYKFTNLDVVRYAILSKGFYNENEFRVKVRYTNWHRCVLVECLYDRKSSLKQEKIRIIGLNPDEEFVFENKQGTWEFKGLAEEHNFN